VARAQGEPFVVGERSLSIQHQTDRGDRDPALGLDQLLRCRLFFPERLLPRVTI